MTQDDQRIYSSDDNGELFVWDRQGILESGRGGEYGEEMVVRRVDYGEERGAIDCILMRGTRLMMSYDDWGFIAIEDFW